MYSKSKKEYLKLLPLLVPFLIFFIYSLILTLLQSFGIGLPVNSSYSGVDSYLFLINDSWFRQSFTYSISIAFQSAIYSIIIGSLLAYWLWRQPLKDQNLLSVYKIPLILPHIVAAFFIQVFFSKTGLISTLFFRLGVIESSRNFPELVYSSKGTGIIMAYIYKEVPFVILFQLSNYRRLDRRLITAATNLGAGKIRIFFKIIFPHLLPTINSTLIILFLYALGAFDIPFLLGASRPEMLPVYIYRIYFESSLDQRPLAMAALIILFLFSSIFISVYYLIINKFSSKERYV